MARSANHIGHWRTYDEVDLVIERDDGSILAIDIKASRRVGSDTFRTLHKLREAFGSKFLAGVVMYLGERTYTYDERFYVLPVDRL